MVSGDYTLESGQAAFLDMLEALGATKHERCCWTVANAGTCRTSFYYAETISKTILEQRQYLKLAYLFLPADNQERRIFSETVAVNRSVFAKAFFDLGGAPAWVTN